MFSLLLWHDLEGSGSTDEFQLLRCCGRNTFAVSFSLLDRCWRGKHYLQRFWEKLPEDGQIVVFDRSWYGRVLKLTRFERQSPLTAASTLTN
jgi:hypothetical protein